VRKAERKDDRARWEKKASRGEKRQGFFRYERYNLRDNLRQIKPVLLFFALFASWVFIQFSCLLWFHLFAFARESSLETRTN
jgi:hypothetical protein